MTIMLQATGLSKRFVMHHQNHVQLPVFAEVDLTVERGEAVILSGPSGVGKSSLLRILYGNYRPSQGHVFVRHGDEMIDIVTATPRRVLDIRRTSMSFVSQFLRVIPRVSTLDIVKDPMLARGWDDATATARAQGMLTRLNLPERLWPLAPATFSGGEQQRVNIARSFADPAPIMLLDEPTASLDAANRDVVVDLIRDARRQGAAIVGIFHDEAVRERIATRYLNLTHYKAAA
ncbi:phosphonate C-P lyase system protein PhnL [Methylovirgula sp. 4M-Z18]|uniref:phosphonate C-P lyase system protein PhnL n=1 Tax=Methylovirgula sp. 4M-Z18 TaxID=2293567 RepID=UPI000E2EDCC9|nr:phosphonate C-P lyase system protein PhnL [Methylovirgula sp. 4M-Z18]RFB81253.1 phosphonate C-P lyase system protein PhnL [Methylovirgula sp. 4M-Z18]